MIWHFLEVWALIAVAFAVGCVLGAYFYSLAADSRLALVQGAAADQVGDAIDRVKATLGLGPAWRPNHLRSVERTLPPPAREEIEDEFEEDYVDEEAEQLYEPAYRQEPPPLVRREERKAIQWEEATPVRRNEPPLIRREEPRRPAVPERLMRPPVEEPAFVGGDPERIASAMAIGADGVVPKRPPGLSTPRGGVPDNLTRIRGIGERNELLLNSLGIYHFGQIAAWTPAEMRWIGQYLAFPERIERDDWQGQAMILATGGDTGFEKSAERRRRRRHMRKDVSMARQVAAGVAGVLDAGNVHERSTQEDTDGVDGDANEGEGD